MCVQITKEWNPDGVVEPVKEESSRSLYLNSCSLLLALGLSLQAPGI